MAYFLTRDKIKLHYTTFDGDNEPIIFIHGFAQDQKVWGQVVDHFLKNNNKCVTYDWRGMGESETTENLDLNIHAEDLNDLLTYLGLEKVNLIGYCYGCAIVQKFSILYPDKVNKLCFLSATFCQPAYILGIFNSWYNALKEGGFPLLFKISVPYLFGNSFLNTILPNMDKIEKKYIENNQNKDVSIMLNFFENSMGVDKQIPADDFRKITAPTLIIHGLDDKLDSIWHPIQFRKILINSKCIIFKDCGHFIILEKPNLVAEKCIKFFKNNTN